MLTVGYHKFTATQDWSRKPAKKKLNATCNNYMNGLVIATGYRPGTRNTYQIRSAS